MPKIWIGVAEEIENVRDMHNQRTLKFPPGVRLDLALQQKMKNDFISRSYHTMHELIDEVGLTSLGDCETKTFHQMVEIMQDDVHDFYNEHQ